MNATSYRTFGSYRLVHPLGSSIRAFRAIHRETGELCVVKIFHGNRVSPELWGEIGRSLRAFPARQPPICALQEVGLLRGEVYAVAPYLDGENLSKLVKAVTLHREVTTGSLHPRICAFIIAELARGLALRGSESFRHPIFGPDMVSPDDLFVLFDGSVCVLDPAWNWLRAVVAGAPWSSIEHNLAYMLPEGEHPAGKPDAGRVWALGVLLWELLVGYRLFRRYEVKSTLRAVNQRHVPDPRSLNPSVPRSLAELSMKLLSRPGAMSLEELRRALQRESSFRPGEAHQAVNAWLGRLVALRRESGQQRVHRTVDAILDDAQKLWPETEASTTCIIAPPALAAEQPLELSWLEDDPMPRTKAAAEPPSKSRRPFKLLGLLALVVLGTGLSVVPTSTHNGSWASAVQGLSPRDEANGSAAGVEVPVAWSGVRRASEAARAEPRPVKEHVDAGSPHDGEQELVARRKPWVKKSGADPEDDPEKIGFEGRSEIVRRSAEGSARAPSPHKRADEMPVTGDLLVRAGKDTQVSLNDRLLGTGVLSVRLPPGPHQLSFLAPGGQATHVVAQVRPGVLSIVTDE